MKKLVKLVELYRILYENCSWDFSSLVWHEVNLNLVYSRNSFFAYFYISEGKLIKDNKFYLYVKHQ